MVVLLVYILGIIIFHFILYKDNKGEIEQEMLTAVSIFWPVVIILCCMWEIERWFKKTFGD